MDDSVTGGRGATPARHRPWACVGGLLLVSVLSGVAVYLWQAGERRDLVRDLRVAQQRLTAARQDADELRRQLTSIRVHSYPGSSSRDTDLLAVYEGDEDTWRAKISFYIAVPKALPLLGKQRLLAERISDIRFAGLPIEVTRIESRNGKAIAVVNLRDRSDGFSWGSSFFQGSTGGFMTEVTLTYSLLQPDRAGKWVDGVEFLYNGKPVGEWDHIVLSGLWTRKRLAGQGNG